MSKKVDEEVVITSNNNQNTLYGIIIVLLLIIAVGGFFLGMKLGGGGQTITTPVNTETVGGSGIAENIVVTVYDDKRCTDCQTDEIVESLKQVPVLASAEVIVKDFSEDGAEDFLKNNNIELLPAAFLNTNDVGPNLAQSLVKLDEENYFLRLADGNQVKGFNPFNRSENGFPTVDQETISELKVGAYIKGSEDAKITWVEFTDVNCPYCQKMEKDGTANTVLAQFPTELNKSTSNFIGVGGAKTQATAEILECAGSLGGSEVYNAMFAETLVSGNSGEDVLLDLAAEKGLDRAAVQSCFDAGEMKDLVAQKFAVGAEQFGISGTPGNVLVNNETGEYTIVSGAYPADEFVTQINKLLGK